MVVGVPKLYNGYSMLRVCDGGALPADFVEACTIELNMHWIEVRKRMHKKVRFHKCIIKKDFQDELHVNAAKQNIKKGVWRKCTWDEDMRKVLVGFDMTALLKCFKYPRNTHPTHHKNL